MESKSNFVKGITLTTPTQIDLIRIFNEKETLARKELVAELKAPRTTIFDNLEKLRHKKVIDKFISKEGKRGRPTTFWRRLY